MNIVNKRNWYFIAALVIALICIISLAVQGLNRGIDFQAGTQVTVKFDQTVTKDQLKAEMETLGFKDLSISQSLSVSGQFVIQTRELALQETQKLEADLTAKFGTLNFGYHSIPAKTASSSLRNAIIAVVIAVIGMLIYIAWAFRKMPSPFKFGVSAVVGLAFDIIVTLGVYSIFGGIMGWSIDLMFVAGILAVLGYSINNTIIVFDRIRENTTRGLSSDIEVVANASIVETLGRSFNSSLTVLFTLFILLMFVGSTIQNFVIVLIIGTISGVLTSTFLSPELLITWMKKKVTPNSSAVKAKA